LHPNEAAVMLGKPGPQPNSQTVHSGRQYFSITKEAVRADGHTCVARKLVDDGRVGDGLSRVGESEAV
jgi:hypothetical protein